jgi:hypothetical protein
MSNMVGGGLSNEDAAAGKRGRMAGGGKEGGSPGGGPGGSPYGGRRPRDMERVLIWIRGRGAKEMIGGGWLAPKS